MEYNPNNVLVYHQDDKVVSKRYRVTIDGGVSKDACYRVQIRLNKDGLLNLKVFDSEKKEVLLNEKCLRL